MRKGERELHVPPLKVADPRTIQTVQPLLQVEAVEHIFGAPELESELDILDGLSFLIDKSLVKQKVIDGESRFSMLETIVEYARIRFEERPEAGMVREHHARYYLELAVEAESELHGPEQLR